MFINITSCPSAAWGKEQLAAAQEYGTVIDVPFPVVPAETTKNGMYTLAHSVVQAVQNIPRTEKIEAFLVQGEATLAYCLVGELREDFPLTKVVAAVYSDNEFVKFREYVGGEVFWG